MKPKCYNLLFFYIFFNGDNMKKIIIHLLIVAILLIPNIKVLAIEEGEKDIEEKEKSTEENNNDNKINLAENAKSAIIIEASTGKVIFEKNSNEKLAMASMTKMMTLLLIMENIENGNLKWDEMITTSENASSMGGSQIFLQTGEQMSVEDLVKGICIASGNDASVALAERIGGTEEEFVKMMNNRAKDLGLKNTNFVNAYGFDDDNHYSTAYDMAMIAKELVKHKKILEYSGTYEDYLRKNTPNSLWLVNTNKLVRYYSGVDGLKTGFTDKAMYCLTSTAYKNNMRLITVVMGEPSSTIRSSETAAMLDYGFNTYQMDTILSKDKVLKKVKISMGEKEYGEAVCKDDINILNTKTGDKRKTSYKININNVSAPVKIGDKIGEVEVSEGNKTIMIMDITVKENINKANILKVFLRDLKDTVLGNI